MEIASYKTSDQNTQEFKTLVEDKYQNVYIKIYNKIRVLKMEVCILFMYIYICMCIL